VAKVNHISKRVKKIGPPTNPAMRLGEQFPSLMQNNLFMCVNKNARKKYYRYCVG